VQSSDWKVKAKLGKPATAPSLKSRSESETVVTVAEVVGATSSELFCR